MARAPEETQAAEVAAIRLWGVVTSGRDEKT